MTRRAAAPAIVLVMGALLAAPVEAQFGRNKVQYRSFDFEVIRTEHFDVHFYPEARAAALDAARMAERSYARLSRLLRHEFEERKPILVYASHAHFQQTNALRGLISEGTGGVTESLKSRVILPFTGSYPDFDHVLTHELVHSFQFDVIFRHGVVTDAAPRVGRIPLWFMEGMAEYLALGRIDPHTASWVRDAVVRGYIRSIADMNRRDDYLSYRFGQSLWAYIGATWGDEVIGILLQKAPRIGVERAFSSTLGVSLEELSRSWLASVRSRHLPELARHDGPDRVARRLTEQERPGQPWYLAPALSADGERLVFASQRDGFFMDLWLADGETGEVDEKLVSGSRNAGFESLRYQSSAGSFSPDGRLIAFAAQTGGRDALYLYDVESRRVWRRLDFELDGVANPSWSPDGRRIVFTGLDGGVSDLFITDLEGTLTRLTRDRYADLQPSWSPDGRTIAFSSDRGSGARLAELEYGTFSVSLLDLASGRVRVLPHQEEGKSINPAWSPDGSELAWVSDRTGINNLYLYDLEGRTLRQVTDLLTGIIGTNHLTPVLTWSASGRMVFVHFESAGYVLYALEDPRALPSVREWSDDGGPSLVALAGEQPGATARAESGPAPAGPVPVGASSGGSMDPPPRVGSEPAAASPAVGAEPESGTALSLYRTESGLRPSAVLPAAEREGPGPLSVMDLLEEGESALPDTASFEVVDYRARLAADVIGRPELGVQAGGYYGNGVYGGSFIALSDMLGNHNLLMAGNINGSLSDAMAYFGYGYYRHRANLSLVLQQVPFYRYRGFRSYGVSGDGEAEEAAVNVFTRDVIRSADVSATYPFSAFRRIEVGGRVAHFQRDNLYRGYYLEDRRRLDTTERVGSVSYAEPSLAMVFDNALFGWTGPIDGRRYRLQLSHSFGELDFTELLADVRHYWSWRRTVVLATRAVALARTGPDSDRFSLFWGGPYFIRGYDARSYDPASAECEAGRVSGTPSPSLCPARDQLIGSSGAFINTEVRFPVITELRLGPLGQFPPVDGLVFFDAGLAWDERVCSVRTFDPTRECAGEERRVRVAWERDAGEDPYLVRTPLYSWGVGLRVNVFYAVLRLDYAFPLDRERGGLFSLAFGPSF